MTSIDQWRAQIKEAEDPKSLYDLALSLVNELEESRKKINKLEQEAGQYRVEIGRLNVRCPDSVVDTSLVPDWVREEIEKTRWDIIARMDRGRALIGVSYHFVHTRSMSDFKDRDDCWRDVLSAAFYIADEGMMEPIGSQGPHFKEQLRIAEMGRTAAQDSCNFQEKRAVELQAQVDRMVDMGVKAADERIQEMQAQQQAMCQQAFEDGRKAATERCAQYADGLASSSHIEECSSWDALRSLASDFRAGEHEKYAVEQEVAPTPTATVSFGLDLNCDQEQAIEQLKKIVGVVKLTQVFPDKEDPELRAMWCATIWSHEDYRITMEIGATPGVKYAEIAPRRTIQ